MRFTALYENKPTFLFLFLLLFSSFICAQPVNNFACDAFSIACGTNVSGSTIGATPSPEETPQCAFGSANDVYYTFQAYPGYDYTATVNGANYDGVLAVYTGDCNGDLFELNCSDYGTVDGIEEVVDFYVNFETYVLIRTYDYNDSNGDFVLSLNCSLPTNSPCDAIQLSCSDTFSGSTELAYSSGIQPPSCDESTNPDIFFEMEAYIGIDYSVSVIGENFNGVLSAYIGNCDESLSLIACANDSESDGVEETLSFSISQNQPVYIRTYDADGTGSFELSLNCNIPNEDPCEAIQIACGETYSGTNETAQPSGMSAPLCAAGSLEDVFYTFEALPNFIYQVYVQGDNYGAVLVAYEGECTDELVEIGCADEGLFAGISEELIIDVDETKTILIRTYDYSDSQGSFEISLNCTETFDCEQEQANIGDTCNDYDPFTTNNFIASNCECIGVPTNAVMEGTADWNFQCGSRDITALFYKSTDGEFVATRASNLSEFGLFQFDNVPVGLFNVYLKIEGFLQQGHFGVQTINGVNIISLENIIPGDLNDDNGVNILDFSILSNAFGNVEGQPNYSQNVDINCDGGINILDFSLLASSFGLVGAFQQ